jgi:hypothetical protein
MAYQYRVLKDYSDVEWDYDLVEGDIVTDVDFPEPDHPARLIGKQVLEPANMEAEKLRLADVEPDDE